MGGAKWAIIEKEKKGSEDGARQWRVGAVYIEQTSAIFH